MKILIFSGGTGSRALQQGFNVLYEKRVKPIVVVNAYDNGLSTGAVRTVMGGKILGPSDLRKNQLLQAALNYTCPKEVIDFFNLRITCSSAEEMKSAVTKALPLNVGLGIEKERLFETALSAFFSEKESKIVEYINFSVSNIIYAGLAKEYGYSLEQAGIEIAKNILNLDFDSTMLVSDESLFLQAITESGNIVLDEGEIVKWGRENDKIDSVRLVNIKNEEVVPEVSEIVKEKIEDADVIILSSGTLWSSLIPTYIHKGFSKALEKTRAKIYMVMNNVQDDDMIGVNSFEIQDIVNRYIPMQKITTVFNSCAFPEMRIKNEKFHNIERDLSHVIVDSSDSSLHKLHVYETTSHVEHNGYALARFIMQDYYREHVKSDVYLFDFDDTLVARNLKDEKMSNNVLTHFRHMSADDKNKKYAIVTGNSLKHVNECFQKYAPFPIPLLNFNLYCDGGNSLCSPQISPKSARKDEKPVAFEFVRYVDEKFVLVQKEIDDIYCAVIAAGIPVNKLENRNNVIISVKPLDRNERPKVHKKLVKNLSSYKVQMNGRTTIDICKQGYSKKVVLDEVGKDNRVLFVGDELTEGNDSVMKGCSGVVYFEVKNIYDTFDFLKMLEIN